MKLQRTTLGLLLSALVLGGFVYLYEIRGAEQRQTAETEAKRLFNFTEDQIQAITLKTSQRTLVLKRAKSVSASPQPSPTPKLTPSPTRQSPQWRFETQAPKSPEKPEQGLASEASVAYLASLIATAQRQPLTPDATETTLRVPVNRLAEFGLDQPLATIEVNLDNQTSHRMLLGKPNFNRSAIYAQVDPPATAAVDRRVVLVPTTFENAVNRPLNEWRDPPPAPTSPKS
jgi:hypothetical protein